MSITQSATPAAAQAPTGEPTSQISNSFDESGKQSVEAGTFDFDQETPVVEEKPFVTEIHEEDPFTPEPEQTPEDPNQADPNEPVTPKVEQKPAEPAKQTELKLYAGKFQSVQDLKNSFIELGGDPADYEDNVGGLEQAYQVRQREYSRVRAQITHSNQPTDVPKTVEQLMQEEFAGVDANQFETPQDMMQSLLKGFTNVLNKSQGQQPKPQAGISPEQVARQVKAVEKVTALYSKVPRLKTDKLFQQSFATHIRILCDENRMPMDQEGYEDIHAAFKDFVGGQKAASEEYLKSLGATNDAKVLSTAASSDNTAANPAAGKKIDSGDAIVDEILDYQKDYNRKYQ